MGEPARTPKQQAILDAARQVFLQHGYRAASMDQIASAAAVSKVTIYKHFTDKKTLFAEVITTTIAGVDTAEPLTPERIGDDLPAGLRRVARQTVRAVLDPTVVRMRRRVIGEADEFPDLAQAWYDRSIQSAYDELAELFAQLDSAGRIRAADPSVAASDFLWLVLSVPLNRAMFHHTDEPPTDSEVRRYADSGVSTFMAAYGRRDG